VIIIKNLKVEKPSEPWQVRVDRSSVLGNPFYMKDESDRDSVCDKYEKYLIKKISHPRDEVILAEMQRLRELYDKHGKLELFCFCAPLRCHAETIRDVLLRKRLVMEIRIMVTGHRPNKLFGYNIRDPQYDDIRTFFRAIFKKAQDKYDLVTAVSGMALGVDSIFAQEALAMNIPLFAYVPFKGQESIWNEKDRTEYKRLLERATDVRVVSSVNKNDKSTVVKALLKRNEEMVDNSDLMLAVWNGDSSGGTYQCIQYALKKDIRIIYYNPNTKIIKVKENNK